MAYPNVIKPKTLNSAGIQKAHDEARLTRGAVWLGEKTYNCTTGISIDPTAVSLLGAGAVLDFSNADNDIKAVSFNANYPSQSFNYKRGLAQNFSGFTVTRGRQIHVDNSIGLDFTTVSGGDASSTCTVENICVEGFGTGINIGDNAYIQSFRNMSIGNCNYGAFRHPNTINNGENITFFGGSIFGCNRAFQIQGYPEDWHFFGTSFDGNGSICYSDNLVEFHGCHFESWSQITSGKWQFEGDNGARFKFFGGEIALVDWNNGQINSAHPPMPNLFKSWGTGGAYFHLIGMDDPWANHYTQSLCSDASRLLKLTYQN